MTSDEKETIFLTAFDKACEHFHDVVSGLHPTRDLSKFTDGVKSYCEIFAVGKYRINAVLMCRSICEQIRDYCVTDKIEKTLLNTVARCFGHLAGAMREEAFDHAK